MFFRSIRRGKVLQPSQFVKYVHNTAIKGFTANETSMYNLGRPSYSNAALTKISELLLKIPIYDEKLQLVELGAGTGKFTNSFSEFALQTKLHRKIGSYTAIEPSDGFRASLIDSVSTSVTVTNGTGSKIPLETSSTDAVFVAQAFHWMANTETLTEIYRVLKSKSPLVLIWNSYDYSSSKWLKAIDDEILVPNYGEGVPRQQNGQWRDCFYTDEGIKLFFPAVKTWENRVEHTGTEQLVVDRIMSTSVIAEQSESRRDAIRAHLKRILDTHPDLETARRTGVFTIPYVTELVWMYSRKSSF